MKPTTPLVTASLLLSALFAVSVPASAHDPSYQSVLYDCQYVFASWPGPDLPLELLGVCADNDGTDSADACVSVTPVVRTYSRCVHVHADGNVWVCDGYYAGGDSGLEWDYSLCDHVDTGAVLGVLPDTIPVPALRCSPLDGICIGFDEMDAPWKTRSTRGVGPDLPFFGGDMPSRPNEADDVSCYYKVSVEDSVDYDVCTWGSETTGFNEDFYWQCAGLIDHGNPNYARGRGVCVYRYDEYERSYVCVNTTGINTGLYPVCY